MTTNAFGPGHYANTQEVLVRPTAAGTGIDGRTWFGQCDVNGEGGTNIDDQWLNSLVAELRKIVDSAGGHQSEIGEKMISEAVARYASGAIYMTDSGAVNAYALQTPANFVIPGAYFTGMRIMFRPVNANTGAATVNITSLVTGAATGAKALLKPDGTALAGGEFAALALLEAVYDAAAAGGAGGFRLAPWCLVSATSIVPDIAPFYPEITTNDGVFLFTTSTGQIIINTAQDWIHRALREYSSTSFSGGDRTFATSANKTYHLRWYAPDHANAPSGTYPFGRFMLRDVADTGSYNPSALPDADVGLDTKFDDMLIARVVTNGSNALTVTPLVNKAYLRFQGYQEAVNNGVPIIVTSGSGADGVQYTATFTLNWSRTPYYQITGWAGAGGSSGVHGVANEIHVLNSPNRYAMTPDVVTDFATSGQTFLYGGMKLVAYA
jgi:hypothetical protein